jgi:molybdate transport system substrate-binding protein
MKLCRVIAAVAALGLPLMTVHAQAADIKVLASTAVKSVLEELGPQFEKASGHKLVASYGPAAELRKQIDGGTAFDVAILTTSLTNGLAEAGKIDPASRATVARAGLGVAVAAGAEKADVSTDEALKRTLLNAKSIGYNGVGASRAGIEAMFNKLGIADALKPKVKLLDVSAPLAVAKGDVELGLGPVSEVLPVAGTELAGPFPADVQSYLVFTAGASSASKDAEAAKALIKFLTAPAAAAVLKAKGMEPG